MATVVSRHFLGDAPAFVVPPYELISPFELPLYMVVGLAAGLLGVAFIVILYAAEDFFDWIPLPEYVKAALGGAVVGAIGIWFPQVFGVGYEIINPALTGYGGCRGCSDSCTDYLDHHCLRVDKRLHNYPSAHGSLCGQHGFGRPVEMGYNLRDLAGTVASMAGALDKVHEVNIGNNYVLAEVLTPRRLTLKGLNVHVRHGIEVAFIRTHGEGRGPQIIVPSSDYLIREGDTLVVAGQKKKVHALEEL